MKASKSFQWSDRKFAKTLMACFVSLTPPAASLADERLLDTLQVHGFLSQALIVTDENNFFGPSSHDAGSVEFTELGVNASLRPHQNVLVAAQLLSRRAGGDASDARPTLDYGVIDYQMVSNQARTLGVQAGRFKNPFGLYNQTRDVAFTRPSILLPQSIYFDRTRALGLAADGVNVYLEERLPSGTLRLVSGVGQPQTGSLLAKQLFGDTDAHVSSSSLSAISQLLYEDQNGKFLAALSAANVKLDADLAGNAADFSFQPWIASLQYNEERWSLTAEFALRKQSLEGDHLPRDLDITGHSWYVQYQRRLTPSWSWLVRYDSLVNNIDDRSGRKYEQSGFGPAHSQFADDLTLGLQWTPNARWMLAGEYHHVNGTGWLPTQDNPDTSATRQHWNMLLFQLSLRF